MMKDANPVGRKNKTGLFFWRKQMMNIFLQSWWIENNFNKETENSTSECVRPGMVKGLYKDYKYSFKSFKKYTKACLRDEATRKSGFTAFSCDLDRIKRTSSIRTVDMQWAQLTTGCRCLDLSQELHFCYSGLSEWRSVAQQRRKKLMSEKLKFRQRSWKTCFSFLVFG